MKCGEVMAKNAKTKKDIIIKVVIVVVALILCLAAEALFIYLQRDSIAEQMQAQQAQPAPAQPVTPPTNTKQKAKPTGKPTASKNSKSSAPAGGFRSSAPASGGGSNLSDVVRPYTGNTVSSSGVGGATRKLSGALGLSGAKASSDKGNNDYESKGMTMLMNLCRTGADVKALDMVVKYGADINAQDNEGKTSLMYAAEYNPHLDVIHYLLDNGADASIYDNDGKTALDYTTDNEIARLLQNAMQ